MKLQTLGGVIVGCVAAVSSVSAHPGHELGDVSDPAVGSQWLHSISHVMGIDNPLAMLAVGCVMVGVVGWFVVRLGRD